MSLGSWQNPYGPGAANVPIFYVVPSGANATFQCQDRGYRCSFFPDEYEEVFFAKGGNVAVQLEGSVWTVNDPTTDELELNLCEFTNCYPVCYQNCTCTYADGTDCTESAVAPFPESLPATDTPTPEDPGCAKVANVGMCSTVATADNLQAGQVCEYCYNFCGTNFVGCCDRFGNCGGNACAEGEMEISGCKEVLGTNGPPSNGPPSNGPSGESGSSIRFSAQFAVLTFATSWLLLGQQLN